jgi:tetratricopeptide (TPR) repeat protein
MQKILNYILIFSPLILTSFFIHNSNYPAWTNTLYLLVAVGLVFMIANIINIVNKKEISIANVAALVLGSIVAAGLVIFSDEKVVFALFGKGIAEWTGVSILILFIAFGYFISNKNNIKLSIGVSAIVVAYTVLNYFIIKYLPSVGNYSGYINFPMISFGKLFNYALVFSVVVLLASVIAWWLNKKSIMIANIKSQVILYVLYVVLAVLIFANLTNYTLRYVAADYYIKMGQEVEKNNLAKAKDYVNQAIAIAPFDVYYLSRIDLLSSEIQQLLNTNSTNTEALQNRYKELVEYQISDAKKAVDFDPNNPKNYMALGLAYERATLLTKDEGYRLALEAYEDARALANDKDFVDVAKARLSFSVGKEEEALGFIDRAFAYNPSSTPAFFLTSQYYATKNKLVEAVEFGEKAVLLAPSISESKMHLGQLYLRQEKINESLVLFNSVFEQSNGQDNLALYYMGLGFKIKNDKNNLGVVIEELEKRLGKNIPEIEALKK